MEAVVEQVPSRRTQTFEESPTPTPGVEVMVNHDERSQNQEWARKYDLDLESIEKANQDFFDFIRQQQINDDAVEKENWEPELPLRDEVYRLFWDFEDHVVVQRDFDTARDMLTSLKGLLEDISSLPPLFDPTLSEEQITDDHTLAKAIYEVAVMMSVMTEDQDAFEREYCQLKPYYIDRRSYVVLCGNEFAIMHLNLLRLLLQNRIADFHAELHLISDAAGQKDPYQIMKPFQVIPGAYDRLFTTSQIVNFLLSKTDRDKITGWGMKVCDSSSSMSEGEKMLLFLCEQKLLEYLEKEHPEWEMKNGCVVSKRAEEESSKHCRMIRLINQAFYYLNEAFSLFDKEYKFGNVEMIP